MILWGPVNPSRIGPLKSVSTGDLDLSYVGAQIPLNRAVL